MEFFLDVDGVILDFETAMIDFIRDHYLPDLPVDYVPKSWEMSTEFATLDIVEVWKRFVDSEKFTKLDLLVDADSFNRLSNEYPVYFVTNLPMSQYDDRKKNLELHRLNYEGLSLAGHFNFGDKTYPTKSEAIAGLRQDGEKIVFLDDHPQNCRDVKSSFEDSDVYLMTRPHNLELADEDWIRVENWDEFLNNCLS